MGGNLLKADKFPRRSRYFNVPALQYLQQVVKANIKFSKLTILTVVLIFGLSSSEIAASPQLSSTSDLQQSPNPDKPIEADVSFFIDNLSDIDLNSGSYKIVGQMVVEWRDPRLAFTPDPFHPNRPRELNADAASELLRQIWQPVFEISNERQERTTGVVSLTVWPDGRIRYYEKFDSVPNFRSNLIFYPYGTIDLDLVMTGFLQNRSELVYNLKAFEFQDRTKPDDFIHGHWSFISMDAEELPAKRSDDRSVDYSQIHFKVKLDHESIQAGALMIFVPLIVIFIATSCLLWLDHAHSGPRLEGTIALILTTVALKYALSEEIPSLRYMTMTDLLMIETIVLILVSFVLSVIYFWLHEERSQLVADKFNQIVRVFYPIACVSVLAVSIFVFSLVSKT
ncbi:hypothetical protein [Sphingorhabdus sp.]|uniref:hypothetical protein n=1 Tax=Sphingorhabdus sp. TaxID=1902408 RepID=UPI0037C9C252